MDVLRHLRHGARDDARSTFALDVFYVKELSEKVARRSPKRLRNRRSFRRSVAQNQPSPYKKTGEQKETDDMSSIILYGRFEWHVGGRTKV